MDNFEDGEIRLTPLQLKVIRLRAKGYSISKISDELKVNEGSVSNALKAFNRNYPRALKFIKEVKGSKYFSKDLGSPETQALSIEAKKRLVREGYYFGGRPPVGYKIENHLLVEDSEKSKLVKHIFEGFKDGKSIAELGREVGLDGKHVWKILRNPIYAGYVSFKNEVYPGKHRAIIDPELWKSVQAPDGLLYHIRGATARIPFGFTRKAGHLIKDSEGAKKVALMFKLLLEDKSLREISDMVNIQASTIWRMIKNPKYANKIEVDGKLVDAGVEEIVSFETWKTAQRILNRAPAFVLSAQARKRRMSLAQQTLYGLIKRGPATSAELREMTGYSKTKLFRFLRELRGKGLISRESGKWGKYYA
jgi:DNA-binding MarR family transcriptional regulator/DNA invertase Pin-like site-specific DNA recombinase